MPRLLVIVASTRPGRVGLPVAEWFVGVARSHGPFEVDLADLAVVDLPFLDEPAHPRLGAYEHQHTRDWSARVAAADAVVMVTAEYNHGFPAPLKNAIDFLYNEWNFKPVGFVSYGAVSGGTRAVQMLKPILVNLKMTPLLEAVVIPFIAQFFDEEQRFVATEALEVAAVAMLDELARMENVLRPLRS